jgi:A/G-specific adenine glycosylase
MRAPAAIPVETRLAAPPVPPTGKELVAFRRALLRWYDLHRRDLPWRKTRNPYRIWLSEIMLQQTRVAAVLEHYRIFLERFSDVKELAAAPEDAVLAAWSGLGYYRRARMLHQCAKELVLKQAGRFPRNAEVLQTLPGIGRYTAAAIASIAFDEPIAVVDGNVERVVQRLTGCDLTHAQIWQRAQSILNPARPGDFNQSMMELGATVCLPRGPRCPICPVQKWCVTQQSRLGTDKTRTMERRAPSPGGPLMPNSSRQVKKEICCVLSQRDGHIRLVQRPRKSSLMPGMWELPLLPPKAHRTPASALWRTFRHSITVTDFTVHVHRGPCSPAKSKWIPVASVSHLPITGLTRKILKAAGII